jgi:hypothetical protein
MPICKGCHIELDYYSEEAKPPNSFLITKLERHTGLSWEQCRLHLLREKLDYWREMSRMRPLDWLHSTIDSCGWSEQEVWKHVEERIRFLEQQLP